MRGYIYISSCLKQIIGSSLTRCNRRHVDASVVQSGKTLKYLRKQCMMQGTNKMNITHTHFSVYMRVAEVGFLFWLIMSYHRYALDIVREKLDSMEIRTLIRPAKKLNGFYLLHLAQTS